MAPALTVWQRAQVWFLDNAEGELATIAGDLDAGLRRIRDSGFTAIHTKLHDGQHEENVGFPREIRRRAQALGIDDFLYGGWGQNREDAHADAEKVNGLIAREELDYWVASGEFEYKGDAGSPNWLRMSEFFGRLKEIEPARSLLLAGRFMFVSMPNEPAGGSFDWATVRDANARWGPECYPNEFPDAPSQWPAAAQEVGTRQFFKSYVHPVLGMYGGKQDVRAPEYIADLQRAKSSGFTFGFGVYGGQHLTPEDWNAFAQVIKPAGTRDALAWHPA